MSKNFRGISLRKRLYNSPDRREPALPTPGMHPTKRLPVPSSLREFQRLDRSARSLQSLQPLQVCNRFRNQALMKEVAGWICFASCCAGTVFLEYQMLLLCGAAFFVCASACAVAVISGALYLAPEGEERADGVHIRQRTPPRRFCLGSAGSGGL